MKTLKVLHPLDKNMRYHSLVILIFTFETVYIEGSCLKNVALGKPATQPNVQFSGKAGRAVDGNGDPKYKAGSCTYTTGTPVYWQVDLLAEYNIMAVTITNRADGFERRLNDFVIDVYKTNPLTDPGATAQNCVTFSGTFGAVTRTLFCGPMIQGRYVRVHKIKSGNILSLCELAVHPSDGDSSDSCQPRKGRPSNFITHNQAFMATSGFKEFSGSLMSCVVECFWLPQCDGFNFNGTGNGVGLCELIPVGLGKLVSTSGWTYYQAVCH